MDKIVCTGGLLFWLFVKSWGEIFCGHRNFVPMSTFYVRAKKIRFLKLSKLRYPKAFRLITLMALLVPSVKPFVVVKPFCNTFG